MFSTPKNLLTQLKRLQKKHLRNNFPVERNFTQPLPLKLISMSNYVNRKFSTANIVNVDDMERE